MKSCVLLFAVVGVASLVGCSASGTKAPNVTDSIRGALDTAGFKDVKVTQDREKGVVTLNGRVTTEPDKLQAGSIAKSFAGNQVVANQIAVVPIGAEGDAGKVNSALDKAIEKNLEAALILEKLDDNVKYSVKNHVVTLSGDVSSQTLRTRAERIATAVPNVEQVVNELQVKGQKATSSN